MATRYNTDGKLTEDPAGALVRGQDYDEELGALEAQLREAVSGRDDAIAQATARLTQELRDVREGLEQRVSDLQTMLDAANHNRNALAADLENALRELDELRERFMTMERGVILAQEGLEAVLPRPQPEPAETLLEQIGKLISERGRDGSVTLKP